MIFIRKLFISGDTDILPVQVLDPNPNPNPNPGLGLSLDNESSMDKYIYAARRGGTRIDKTKPILPGAILIINNHEKKHIEVKVDTGNLLYKKWGKDIKKTYTLFFCEDTYRHKRTDIDTDGKITLLAPPMSCTICLPYIKKHIPITEEKFKKAFLQKIKISPSNSVNATIKPCIKKEKNGDADKRDTDKKSVSFNNTVKMEIEMETRETGMEVEIKMDEVEEVRSKNFHLNPDCLNRLTLQEIVDILAVTATKKDACLPETQAMEDSLNLESVKSALYDIPPLWQQ